mgnify:CR=1 FL=1
MFVRSPLGGQSSDVYVELGRLQKLSDRRGRENVVNVRAWYNFAEGFDFGQGVKIDGVQRITDQYLQMASLTAASDKERWSAVAQYLDNAQSLFGDPSADGFFFNRLDKIFAAFARATVLFLSTCRSIDCTQRAGCAAPAYRSSISSSGFLRKAAGAFDMVGRD